MSARRLKEMTEPDMRRARFTALACACVVGAAAVALASAPEPRLGASRPTSSGGVAGDEVHAAARAARLFLDDYLAWLAGRRTPAWIRAASAGLRKRLAGDHVRPSRVARRRRARIAELHTQLTGPHAGRAVARILDGDTTLRVELELKRTRLGWEVTDARP